jgi:hypothetical protein
MLSILFFLLVVVVVTVLPVMLAAGLVGARNAGFWAALVAVLLHAGLSQLAHHLIGDPLLALVLRLLGGAAIYAYALETSLWRGFAVSVLAVAIAWLIGLGALLLLGTQMWVWW